MFLPQANPLFVDSVFEKIKLTRALTDLNSLTALHNNSLKSSISNDLSVCEEYVPARDVAVLPLKLHPAKSGFSTASGQARMLHDLASIELQAMELGLRTLTEFPEAPEAFKEELFRVVLSESDHLEMCLLEIEKLGHRWGDWPVHLGLWQATSLKDSLLDRILIVHRYLEGSGLDAGDTLLRRLQAVDAPMVKKAVRIIGEEEIGHVLFGSNWYRRICQSEGLDSSTDFVDRMNRLRAVLPKRIEPIKDDLRQKAGFDANEISYLKRLRESFLDKESPYKK